AGIVVDFKTAGATYSWSGPSAWLSSRNVLTHLLAPDATLSYNLATRTSTFNGKAVKYSAQPTWSASLLRAPGPGGLILGGDVSLCCRPRRRPPRRSRALRLRRPGQGLWPLANRRRRRRLCEHNRRTASNQHLHPSAQQGRLAGSALQCLAAHLRRLQLRPAS